MSNDLITAIRFLLSESWRFFTDTIVPGTNFSVATLLIGLIIATFGLRVLGWILSSKVDSSSGSAVKSSDQNTKR